MNKIKDNIIIILLIVSIASSIYFFIQLRKSENRNIQLMQQSLMSRRDKSGKYIDPYIKSQVKNTITKHSSEILECYKAYLDKSNNSEKKEGNVTMDWQIDDDGDVISPAIVFSAIPDDEFKKCLVEKIKNWKFPPPSYGQMKYVEHTFRFMDKDEGKK